MSTETPNQNEGMAEDAKRPSRTPCSTAIDPDGIGYYDDEDYSEPEPPICEHCSGTGGDPWNDGILPCPECDGEGYKWWL